MVFPEVGHGYETWTINKPDCRRTDAFKLWCWRRLLQVPWIKRTVIQSILKEINPECSSEELMLKFGHLMQRADLLEKALILGKTEGKRRRGQQE